MATIHAFYTKKNFFGVMDYKQYDDEISVNFAEEMKQVLKKCFMSFGKVRDFSFRVDFKIDGKEERYVCAQEYNSPGIYRVTKCWGQSSYDPDVFYTVRNFNKKMLDLLKLEGNEIVEIPADE